MFSLDILSHRMSAIGISRQLSGANQLGRVGGTKFKHIIPSERPTYASRSLDVGIAR